MLSPSVALRLFLLTLSHVKPANIRRVFTMMSPSRNIIHMSTIKALTNAGHSLYSDFAKNSNFHHIYILVEMDDAKRLKKMFMHLAEKYVLKMARGNFSGLALMNEIRQKSLYDPAFREVLNNNGDINDFIASADNGAIFFSLGTNLKSADFYADATQAVFNCLPLSLSGGSSNLISKLTHPIRHLWPHSKGLDQLSWLRYYHWIVIFFVYSLRDKSVLSRIPYHGHMRTSNQPSHYIYLEATSQESSQQNTHSPPPVPYQSHIGNGIPQLYLRCACQQGNGTILNSGKDFADSQGTEVPTQMENFLANTFINSQCDVKGTCKTQDDPLIQNLALFHCSSGDFALKHL